MNPRTKILIVAALAAAVAATVALRESKARIDPTPRTAEAAKVAEVPTAAARLPKLLDLGADKCIPCKAMAPILESLRQEYAGRFDVEFIDVWKNGDAGKLYGVEMIPTQIFFDADGKELYRHVGFFGREDILTQWRELGVDVSGAGPSSAIVREQAIAPDTRPREAACFMCDGDVDPKGRTLVQGQEEQRVLCSPHCYFIYFSSLVGADPRTEDAKVMVTDAESGRLVPATGASYLYGMDPTGRATVRSFADKTAATRAQQNSPGNLVSWDVLRAKELATRCAFCDRAVYPEDACTVKFGDTRGYGCCTHCSLGVAARHQKDIEVEARDGYSGDLIRVKTLNGMIASIEPASAVAWFGQKPTPDGKWVSAGCFKQGFFVNQGNLIKWLEARPAMTGRQISIAQALTDKMKLTPEQIAKACKLGECK